MAGPPPRPGILQGVPNSRAGTTRSPRRAGRGRGRGSGGRRPPKWALWVLGAMVLVLAVVIVVTGGTTAFAPVPVPTAQVTPHASLAPSEPDASQAPAPIDADAETVPVTDPDSATAQALAALDGLAAVSGYAPVDYDRALFGQAWADVDRNGCDTRNDILARDLLNPVFKEGTRNCKVLSGELLDPYDASVVEFVSGQNTSVLVQIDHVVSLAWAWERGAYAWTNEQRTAFANDPMNLIAASQATNQSKSASGPADWLPPEPALSCRYVERWVSVLNDYDLGIDDENRSAAREVLEDCAR